MNSSQLLGAEDQHATEFQLLINQRKNLIQPAQIDKRVHACNQVVPIIGDPQEIGDIGLM